MASSISRDAEMPRRPNARDFLPLKNDVLLILIAVSREPRHGYGIIRRIDEETGGEVVLQTGALYRRLRELLNQNLLMETDAPPGEESEDERRRYYTLTALGGEVLAAETDRLARLVKAAGGGAPLRRVRPA